MIYTTNSASETQKYAQKYAQKYKDGGVFLLNGNLGSGKTTFVGAFAHELGIQNNIVSPTFTIMKIYPLPHFQDKQLIHIDLYRLEDKNLNQIGIDEIFNNPNNLILIEWADKLPKENIPKNAVEIYFEYLGKNKRQLTVID